MNAPKQANVAALASGKTHMELTPVTSSSIRAIGHDPSTNTLAVQFVSGRTYHYHGVTSDEHAALMAAPSIGKHHNAHVRGKFDHADMTERS